MRVLVTGGTGFVGGHTVAALRRAGHDVRLLARTRDRAESVLRLHGLDPSEVEVALGDMTDAGPVREAVAGCDAVVHAAAVYSLDPRDGDTMVRTGPEGARIVLGSALEAGATRAVHVSSVAAMLSRRPGTRLTPSSPVGDLRSPYYVSKQLADQVVRGMQAAGAAVTRFHPAGVVGPLDPHRNETNESLRGLLAARVSAWTREPFGYCDVRDCAAVLVALAEGRGDDRPAWMPPVAMVDASRVLAEVTGRQLRVVRSPARVAYAALRPADAVVRRLPRSVPAFPVAGLESFAAGNIVDDERSWEALGVVRTDVLTSFRDTVRWLVERGDLTARQAGTAV
ncbi:MAG: NAD-dependent epimerase/dehydratase family protein [Candidatus Nanopelagicales bacterium]